LTRRRADFGHVRHNVLVRVKRRQAPIPRNAGRAEDGVDVTLIRWFLSLTPAQRLRALQRRVRAVLEVRSENPGL